MTWIVRAAVPADREQWSALYRGYREFYELPPSDEVVDRVWTWIHDPSHETNALVAENEGILGGLAHVRRFARPSSGTTGLYLDDLYTRPELRGAGIATRLIAEASAIARTEGLSVVRWITDGNNLTARRLYDSVALATPWVTYDIALGE